MSASWAHRAEIERGYPALSAQLAEIDRQADEASKLAPTVLEQIMAQAARKKQVVQDKIDRLRAAHASELLEYDRLDANYERLGAAWVIPRAVALSRHCGMSGSTQAAATDKPGYAGAAAAAARKGSSPDRPTPRPAAYRGLDPAFHDLLSGVVAYATDRSDEGVRNEEMRREVPGLAALSEAEYRFYKSNWREFRAFVADFLATCGVQASWRVTGERRGMRYHLDVVGPGAGGQVDERMLDDAPDAISEAVPTLLADPTDVSPYDPEVAAKTAEELLQVPAFRQTLATVKELLERCSVQDLRVGYVVNQIAGSDILNGVTEQDRPAAARSIIGQLIESGILFEGKSSNGKSVALSPFEPEVAEPAIARPQKEKTFRAGAQKPAAEVDPDEQTALVYRNGLSMGGGDSGNLAAVVSVQSLPEALGIKRSKDPELYAEAVKMLDQVRQNPLGPGTKKFISTGTTVGGKRMSLWRFSPSRCPELTIKSNYRHYRVIYAISEDGAPIFLGVLSHDEMTNFNPRA